MLLTIIDSGSQGNAYLLHNEGEALLIECGVKFSEIKEALNFDFSKVVGCLVTHEHLDHCKSVNYVLDAGINVWMSIGTFRKIKLKTWKFPFLTEDKHRFILGNFEITSFLVEHDAEEPLGFYIYHKEMGSIIFLTDSFYVKYNFSDLTNIMLEVNYDQDILDRNTESGNLPSIVKNRVTRSHMSLSTAKELLLANDISKVNNIVLLHLSVGNSDSRKFKKEIEELTGKNVVIATKGLTIDFNKTSF
jgi:phosphoribosyl 1,2-cyclic phosphodiesterase